MNSVTVQFEIEKETKNTVRYQEVVEGKEKVKVGTIYVQKSTFEDEEFPSTISVTVQW